MNSSDHNRNRFDIERRALLQQGRALTAGVVAGLAGRRSSAADMLETFAPAVPREPSWPLTQVEDPRLGLIIGPGTVLKADGSPFYFLSIIDLDATGGSDYALHRIPLAFFGHGVVPDPSNPERAAVFQKKGKGACEVDLVAGEVLRPIETAANRRFYGHGAYSRDASLLYATETIVEGDYDGLIAVRDAQTHEDLGEFPTYGSSPHDCVLVDDGRVLVITNGGGRRGGVAPSVTYVDVENQQLLEKLEFSTPDINAGHLAVSADGDLAVISAQRDGLKPYENTGGVTLRPKGGEFRTMASPSDVVERLFGETLSLCIDEQRRIVAATTPIANLLTFWNLDTGELVRHYAAHNPRGISLSLDRRHYVLSYEKPPQLSLLSTETLEQVGGADLMQTGMSGSHILNYSLPARLRTSA